MNWRKIAVGLAVVAASGAQMAWGVYDGSGTFTKIASRAELADGYYVVASTNGIVAMTHTNAGTFFTTNTISPSTDVLTDPSPAIVWLIQTNATHGGLTIFNDASNKYVSYSGTANAAHAVAAVNGTTGVWTFADASGAFTVANVAVKTRVLQYNAAAPRFACYTTIQQKLALYKMAAVAHTLPEFGTNPGPLGATSGVAMAFTVTASGSPAPTLALQSEAAAGSVSFTPDTGVLDYTPDPGDAGSQDFIFTASNMVGVATHTVVVTVVNVAVEPSFTSGTSYGATSLVAMAFTVAASGNPAPTLALLSEDAVGSVDFTSGTGVLDYTPATNDVGTKSFTFTASNSAGVATQAVSVAVVAAPTAIPTVSVTSINTNSFTVNWTACTDATNYQVQVATDTDFTAGGSGANWVEEGFASATPAGWTIAAGGTYSSSPYVGTTLDGIYSLKFSASGNSAVTPTFATGATNLQFWSYGNLGGGSTFAISGLVSGVWTLIDTVTVTQNGATYNVPLSSQTTRIGFYFTKNTYNCALDDVLVQTTTAGGSLVADATVAALTYNATGLEMETTYYVRARKEGGEWSSLVSATTTSPTPTAPTFTSGNAFGATTGVARTFTVTAAGTPAPSLALASTTASAGYNFAEERGELSYTPPLADANKIQTFTFTASNSLGVATQTVSATVVEAPPEPPTIDPLAPLAVFAGQTANVWIVAREAEGDAITLFASNLPANASFATVTGTGAISNLFAFSPSSNQAGQSYSVGFYASDVDGTTSRTLTITVAVDDPWADYYAPCYSNGVLKTGDNLKNALHDIIAGHTSFSYAATENILKVIDECPTNSTMVQLLYLQHGRAKTSFGGLAGQWNREHVWAKSHGFPDEGATPCYSDVHHLHPTDVAINSLRGNLDFDIAGGYSNSYSVITNVAFEPPDAGKGDAARAMFYMAVRYNGEGDTASTEDLELTNAIPTSIYTPWFGKLATLLDWNELDEVNDYEIRRNNLIHSDYQKNRNPFVDHPEWARIVFDPTYVVPYTLTASAGAGGAISPASASVTNAGSQTFTITADAGYHIATILRNGVLVTPTNTYAGFSSYEYLWSDVTNSGTISVTFVLAVPPQSAPASAWADPTNTHSFTANWSDVSEATGYQLDIRGPATSAVPGSVTALTEAFDSVTGNGGTAVDPLLFPGWTFANVYAATNELRVGSSSQGLVMTPSMDLGTTVAVSFAATRYGTDAPTVVVGLTNAGGAYVEQTVAVPAGGTNCTLVFTAGASGSRVIWKGNGASNQRFYLDDIEVSYWGTTAGGAPISLTGYPTNVGLSTSVGVSNLSPSTEYEIYVAATDATRTSTWTSATVTTLDGVKSDQAIVFSVVAQQITTNLVTLVAAADSGLPVSFTVASGPGAIAGGNLLTFTGAGEVSVVASQAGNTEFNPASNVTNVFVVSKAWAVITLGNLIQTYDGTPKSATATTVPADLAVEFTYDGSAIAPSAEGSYAVIGTVNDAMCSGEAIGTLVITAEALTSFQLWVRDEQFQSLSDPNFATNADYDGDGMNTWEEYLADTAPYNSNSVLALTGQYFIVSASNAVGSVRLSFPASTNRYYQLVYSTNLFSPTIVSNLGQGVSGMAITNNGAGTWYGRIRASPTPLP